MIKTTLLSYLLIISCVAYGEGFIADTLVRGKNKFVPIAQLVPEDMIQSSDLKENCVERPITGITTIQTFELIKLSLKQKSGTCIKRTSLYTAPNQKFYLFHSRKWVESQNLKCGDQLLSSCSHLVEVEDIQHLSQEATLYDLEVDDYHNFCVTELEVVVHNIAFTIPLLAWGAEGVVVTTWPVIAQAIGYGLVAAGITYAGRKMGAKVDLDYSGKGLNTIHHATKAPGKPTEADGYIPPKNWDGKKVRSPNGRGYGWPDKNGSVWVPSGVGGSQPGTNGPAHGGEQWDVQHENGGYDNVYPGGKVRPGKPGKGK